MGDNWDDDDFEPEVEGLAPPPPPEEELVAPVEKAKPAPKKKKEKAYDMEDLGRELTGAEREEMQRRADRLAARELMGLEGSDDEEDDKNAWANIMSVEEFGEWGTKMAGVFNSRHKATNYGHFLSKLLAGLATDLSHLEVKKMSDLLKKIADDKKKELDKKKPIVGKKRPNLKATGAKGGDDMYDDFGGGGGSGWRADDLDDDFM